MTTLDDLRLSSNVAAPALAGTQTFELHAYCYADRIEILPEITSVFVACGGWVLERRTVSSTSMDYRFEIQLDAVIDLYGALVGLGLELTRSTHATLTDLCTCSTYPSCSAGVQTVTMRLAVSFLADVTLHSILMTGAAMA